MTTDKPRDLDTLLALDTYQGMTDTEIASVIDYKERIARLEAVKQALDEHEQAARTGLDAAASDMRASAKSAFQAALAYSPDFKEVQANG